MNLVDLIGEKCKIIKCKVKVICKFVSGLAYCATLILDIYIISLSVYLSSDFDYYYTISNSNKYTSKIKKGLLKTG